MHRLESKKVNKLLLVLISILVLALTFSTYLTLNNQQKIEQLTTQVDANTQLQTQLDQKMKDYDQLKTDFDNLKVENNDLKTKLDDITSKYEALKKQASLVSGNTVYLTFDDGPSFNTDKVLDVLRQYGIKGTFFVTGQGDSHYFDKFVNEGHTLALHTYSHDYNNIYASSDAFFNDLYQIRDRIYNQVGLSSHFFRFAGGSSNSYVTPTILSQIIQRANSEGFKYFDWNCSSGDASAPLVDVDILINNATSCSKTETIVLLMHDASGKTTTPLSLPQIIEYYQKIGYQFKAIDDNTPLIQHRTS